MIKAQEIEKLREFIRSLPDESYLKPWLIEVESQVFADIGNDFVVSPTIRATEAECQRMLEAAQATVSLILSQAEQKAEKITERAERERDGILSSLHRAVKVVSEW